MRQYFLDPTPQGVTRPGFLDDLNAEQRRVAEAGAGPLLVLAGAGTGKTRTLVYRAAHLLSQGVEPERLLMLTFTNRAAKEMTERLSQLVATDADRLWAGTFHRIGNRILRRFADRLGYGTNYGIVARDEAEDLMGAVIVEMLPTVEGRRFPKPEVLLAMLSSAVNTDRPLKDVVHRDYVQFFPLMPKIDEVLTGYLQKKLETNVMDYDDLLVNWRLLLTDFEDVRAQYQEQFEYILVDEYQDTNRLQSAVIRLLAEPRRNLMVVGDDCQAIYSFRGATVKNILDFPQEYPGAQVHRLETNYRSIPQVLDIANASIRHNRHQFDKTLKSTRDAGERPAYAILTDGDMQARFVAQRVLELREEGIELTSIAVLYRAHYQAMELQLELQRRGVPFTIRSGLRFFEQGHIRDLLAHLRILVNPLDQLAWLRVLKLRDGIGNRHASTLYAELARGGDPFGALRSGTVGHTLPSRARKSFDEVRELLLDLTRPSMISNPQALFEAVLASGYEMHLRAAAENGEQRIEDIRQLGHFAAQFDDVPGFLQELELVESVAAQDLKKGGQPDECLVLSTVHQAKGLEWKAVFVLGLSEGMFPLARALRTIDEEEEERRLFYVAVTRAKELLYLCHPQWGRDRERSRVLLRPSRFMHEVLSRRPDLVEKWQIGERR
jgi:DNA helicase-2/ATP-dependent DNA helicase PcrA